MPERAPVVLPGELEKKDILDIVSEERRSYIMSRIRSKDTKPEVLVRKGLHRLGYRFRIHNENFTGETRYNIEKIRTANLRSRLFPASAPDVQDCPPTEIKPGFLGQTIRCKYR